MNNIEHGKNIKYHVSVVLILLSCICMLLQMYAIPIKNMSLMSMANRVMAIIWIAAAGMSLFFNGTKDVMEIITLLSLAMIAFVVSLFNYMRTYSLTVLLNFAALPIMLVFFACNEVEDIAKKMLLVTFLVLSFLFINLSNSEAAYRLEDEYGIKYVDDLTMGYPNQNQAAIYLFVCAINLMIGVFYFKRKWIKAVFLLDFAYMLVLLEKTKSRTAIILIGAFLVLLVIPKRSKSLVSSAVLFPLIFALLARWMYPFLKDVTIMGDSLLNGREDVYSRYFDNLSPSVVLFGDLQKFHFDNLHNAYIAIAATTGVPVLICYMYMLKKHIGHNCEMGINKGYESVALVGLVCIILYASTEAAGLIGGMNYAFMSLSMFMYFSKPFAKVNRT